MSYNAIAAKMVKDTRLVFSYFRGEITKEEFDKSGIKLDSHHIGHLKTKHKSDGKD